MSEDWTEYAIRDKGLFMTHCISENKTKQNIWVYVCVRACVCLSGPRPVASQMGVCEEDYYCKPALPTHTVSQTYIHKTHFPHHPTAILYYVQQHFEKPGILFRIQEKEQHIFNGGSRTEKEHVYAFLMSL